jgi:hypothetical protein
MKIYIVTEQVMNGTVTMNTMVSGIKAKDFRWAVLKLKRKLAKFQFPSKIYTDSDTEFSYSINGQEFPLFGRMTDKPLKIIT